MPRPPRIAPGGLVYHVLNRANARRPIFLTDGDYAAFERILSEALSREAPRRGPVELFAYCLMPTHFHLVLRPAADGQLSQFMRWLTVTHTQRYHAHKHTSGAGHLYQGRFKSFPVETDQHFIILCRYVERNALRAGLVTRAEDWRWSSLHRRTRGEELQLPLSPWPVEEPIDYLALVNRPQSPAEEQALRTSIRKSRPFGSDDYQQWTTEALALAPTYRDPGRPKALSNTSGAK